jgi:hypothetical protein
MPGLEGTHPPSPASHTKPNSDVHREKEVSGVINATNTTAAGHV